MRQAAREGVLLALDDYEADSDPRVEAWSRIAKHPFFADCYSTDGTLIDAMLAKPIVGRDLVSLLVEHRPKPPAAQS